VKLMRNSAFMGTVAITLILSIYFVFVADRAFAFLSADAGVAKALGTAMLVLPVIGVWFLVHELRLGSTVQKMADRLDAEGRLPIHDGDTKPGGKLTREAAEAVFEVASRQVEFAPKDWAAWFHLAFAYDAAGERAQARKSLRQAADLFRAERKRATR